MTTQNLQSTIGCAHEFSPLPTTTNKEITIQQELLAQAFQEQVNVLSPQYFANAEEYLLTAQKENEKGKSSEAMFESLDYSKAYLKY